MDLRDPETWLFVGGAALAGAIVGALVANAASPPAASAPAPSPAPSSGSQSGLQPVLATTLQSGWVYYLTMTGSGASDTAGISSTLQSLGFSEAGQKGQAPKVTAHGAGAASALATFNGPVGTSLPAPTSTLVFQAAGYPTPE